MTKGVQWGGTLLLIYGMLSQFVMSVVILMTDLPELLKYRDLLSCSLMGLIAAYLAIRMNVLRRPPFKKYKLTFVGLRYGEMLRLRDRLYLFRIYIVVALLFLLGGLYAAYQLHLQ